MERRPRTITLRVVILTSFFVVVFLLLPVLIAALDVG